MKSKTFIAIAAAAAGYFIARHQVQKEMIKRLLEGKDIIKYNDKNIYAVNICALDEEEDMI